MVIENHPCEIRAKQGFFRLSETFFSHSSLECRQRKSGVCAPDKSQKGQTQSFATREAQELANRVQKKTTLRKNHLGNTGNRRALFFPFSKSSDWQNTAFLIRPCFRLKDRTRPFVLSGKCRTFLYCIFPT